MSFLYYIIKKLMPRYFSKMKIPEVLYALKTKTGLVEGDVVDARLVYPALTNNANVEEAAREQAKIDYQDKASRQNKRW